MSSRAKAAAALASLGILGLGWSTATADGHAVPASGQTTATGTTTSGTTATGSRTSGTSTDGTETSGTYADGTYTGTAARHRYGSVTVTVTVSGGRITDVSEQVVSDGDRKSNQINARAVPVVRSAVLAANSADVATVSGATYTTQAYLTSLQSALDQAGAR